MQLAYTYVVVVHNKTTYTKRSEYQYTSAVLCLSLHLTL